MAGSTTAPLWRRDRARRAVVVAGVALALLFAAFPIGPAAARRSGFSRNQTRSGDSGIWTEPSMNLVGPAALGLMSKSKICVGSHSVAQALGTSTTPLMWPCTGAVPRME